MVDAPVRLRLEIREGLNDPLAVIGGLVDSSREIESALREWVRVARSKGHTWQEIAQALQVSRQSAWQRFKDVPVRRATIADPVFASAVEHAYFRELERTTLEADDDLEAVHAELLAGAISAADRTNGGLRFKRLDGADELVERLLLALSRARR